MDQSSRMQSVPLDERLAGLIKAPKHVASAPQDDVCRSANQRFTSNAGDKNQPNITGRNRKPQG